MSENIKSLNLKIAEQEKKLKQLKEQKAQAERRARAAEKKRLRANDTRRKILLGAWLFEMIKQGKLSREWVKTNIDPFLKRNNDRELFELPPLPEPKETQQSQIEVAPKAQNNSNSLF